MLAGWKSKKLEKKLTSVKIKQQMDMNLRGQILGSCPFDDIIIKHVTMPELAASSPTNLDYKGVPSWCKNQKKVVI